MPVEVIAEIGSCHDGSLDKALALVNAAASCGADIVKAQFWSSARRMAARRHAPEYEAVYAAYRVPEAWLPILRAEATRVGLGFACSSFLPEDVETVAAYADILKIASFEANDEQLLISHARILNPLDNKDHRVIVSLGLNAIRAVVYAMLGSRPEYLHCVSAYPAPLMSLHLSSLPHYDGYSDHSGDVRVGGWAVAFGARIVEAHLRLDDTNNHNPDAGPHALCPGAFAAYVQDIRDVERVRYGTAADAEAPMRRYVVR